MTTTDPLLIDFDAFRAEQQARPLIIRVGGQDYALPSSPPASVALDGIRLARSGATSVAADEVANLADGLFGAAVLDELVRVHRLTVVELQALIGRVMDAYAAEASPPPNRASRRSQRRTPST
jgi:hypothetical protein